MLEMPQNGAVLVVELENSNFQTTTSKEKPTYTFKRRQRAKHHATKTLASFEAIITQLANTVGGTDLSKTFIKAIPTYTFKGRRRAKIHAAKTLALSEATITQLTNTVRDTDLGKLAGSLIIRILARIPSSKCTNANPLKRRQNAKIHATKTLAPLEAMITQLMNTVGDANLLNSSQLKTFNTNPLKRRRTAKRNATKTLASIEAAFAQITNTVGDANLSNSTTLKTRNTNPLK